MGPTREELDEAVAEGVLSSEQAERLAQWLAAREVGRARPGLASDLPKFDLLHLLYYGGALLVLGGMGWWMNQAIEKLAAWGVVLLAAAYGLVFALLGVGLRLRFRLASHLLYLLAVAMTPLAIYGLERMLGWWPAPRDYHLTFGHWVILWTGTLVVALVAFGASRVPLLLAAVSPAFGSLCMVATDWWLGRSHAPGERWAAIAAGLVLIVVGWMVDRRSPEDFAFWLYIFGALGFWGGLAAVPAKGELGELAFFLINLALINAALLLQRKVFLIVGALGCAYYFGHLAFHLFRDSLGVPLVLSLLGLMLILLAVQFQRRQEAIEASLLQILPAGLRAALPRHRRHSLS